MVFGDDHNESMVSKPEKKKIISSTILLYLEIREYAAMDLKPSEYILYDQNVFNFILAWLYLQDNVEEERIQKILDYYIPYMKNYIILVANLDIESNALRLRDRIDGHSRFDTFQGDELIANLHRNYANFARLLKVIEDNHLTVINVDMNNTLEENTAKICRELAKCAQ